MPRLFHCSIIGSSSAPRWQPRAGITCTFSQLMKQPRCMKDRIQRQHCWVAQTRTVINIPWYVTTWNSVPRTTSALENRDCYTTVAHPRKAEQPSHPQLSGQEVKIPLGCEDHKELVLLFRTTHVQLSFRNWAQAPLCSCLKRDIRGKQPLPLRAFRRFAQILIATVF